jgi:hypothetical protein
MKRVEDKRGTLTNIAIQVMSACLFPVGLLQVLSYRLVGVDADYQWGYAQARPVSQTTKGQIRFARTFPHVLVFSVAIVLALLAQGLL